MTMQVDIRAQVLAELRERFDAPSLEELVPGTCLDLSAPPSWSFLRPRSEWPPPEEASLSDARVLPLVYHAYTGPPPLGYLYGLVRGMATVGHLLDDSGLRVLQDIIAAVVEHTVKGGPLPRMACDLLPDLHRSALTIVRAADAANLRHLLAWNYGLYWAAALVLPPDGYTRERALSWLAEVASRFGSLGVVPS